MKTFHRVVLGFPWLVVVFFVLVTLIAGFYATQFRVDASASTLLMKNNQNYIQTQIVNQRFNPDEFVLVALEPKNGEVFSTQTFEVIEELSRHFEELERATTTTSILNVPLLSQLPELSADIEPQDWTWQSQRYAPEKMAEIFQDHPLFTDLLVNKAQTATAIQIVFAANEQLQSIDVAILDIQKQVMQRQLTDQENTRIGALQSEADELRLRLNQQREKEIQAIYDIIEPYKQYANIHIGGTHVLGQQLIDIISRDLQLFGGVIAVAVSLLLLILFRQLRWVVLPVTCCAVSVLLAMGIFGFLDIRTTVISANFIALQLILTLAIVIHLSSEYLQLRRRHSDKRHQQLLQLTIEKKLKPCLFAGITTSVGFGSLVFSGIQPVNTFGWMMIVAISLSIVVSLLLFPAILSLYGQTDKTIDHPVIAKLMGAFYVLSVRFPVAIVILGGLFAVWAVSGLFRLDVENSFIDYFHESTAVHQELSFIDREFGGSTPLDIIYLVTPGSAAEQREVELAARDVQNLQIVQTVLQQYDAVGSTSSLINFTELAKQINDNKPLTEYELTALYRLLDKSLKDKLVQSYYASEHGQLRISARIQDTSENFKRTEFLASLKKDIEAQGLSEKQFFVTNLFVLYQDMLKKLYSSQILTLGLVFAALTIVLVVVFKSVKVALIAIIPNILTTLGILGIMGWMGIPLNIMTITIAAIAMGIAVDDTIHFVHRYLEEIGGAGAGNALKNTFDSIGFALFCTTVAIAAGFSLLSFSDFIPTVLFGLLTALAMLLAFIVDLTLLPVLLRKFLSR